MRCRIAVAAMLWVAGMAGCGRAFGQVRPALFSDPSVLSGTALHSRINSSISADVSYLLLDAQTGQLLAARWKEPDRTIPVGSLVKPFTALAYAEGHQYTFPEHVCSAGTCWRPQGHGRMALRAAIANSCNSYFVTLAAKLNASDVRGVAQRFGLQGPPLSASPEALAGERGVWRESPLAAASAYVEFIRRRSQPGIADVVAGMKQAAQNGTASALHTSALAKTGTAPCMHGTGTGDGFTLVAWPIDVPRYVLLVRQHNVPGSRAAASAGMIVRAVEQKQ